MRLGAYAVDLVFERVRGGIAERRDGLERRRQHDPPGAPRRQHRLREATTAGQRGEITRVGHERRGAPGFVRREVERPRYRPLHHAVLRPDPHFAAERLAEILGFDRGRRRERGIEERAFPRSTRFRRQCVAQVPHRLELQAGPCLGALDASEEQGESLGELAGLAGAGHDDAFVVARRVAHDVQQNREADAQRPTVSHGQEAPGGKARRGDEGLVVAVPRHCGQELARDGLLLLDPRPALPRQVERSREVFHEALRSSILCAS